MKQSIQFRLGQQLTMTPQLQQAIRLLQLSTSDLRQEIQEALDSNLMLENAEEAEHLDGYDHFRSTDETLETAGVAADSEQEVRRSWSCNGTFSNTGEEAMKPMVLRDVAGALELHESTISRVTAKKYMCTPKGTFEFKYFFSSHLDTDSGGERSSTAVRACIRKLVAAENPRRPLSDNTIATVLAEQGIRVAWRTVAKYREGMGVPSSNERKRLG